jgi:single-strand DNA-binding protein
MFDTPVTIVGNVITAPEWRRTNVTNALVANFKVASSSRRYDKETGRWIDRPSLRVRVTCWRRLAEGVASSLMVGDPVVVTGRMYTRDWTADDGTRRASYELEAAAVGHDLARGRGKFTRHRSNTATSAVENAESDARVAGEPSEAIDTSMPPPEECNELFDDFGDTGFAPPPSLEADIPESGSQPAPEEAPAADQDRTGETAGSVRVPEPDQRVDALGVGEAEAGQAEREEPTARGERVRRGRSRVPVPA